MGNFSVMVEHQTVERLHVHCTAQLNVCARAVNRSCHHSRGHFSCTYDSCGTPDIDERGPDHVNNLVLVALALRVGRALPVKPSTERRTTSKEQTCMMSDSMRHTPSRVRASGDVTVFCKIGIISPNIFSPNL
jgi:hypothetical protein